MSLNVLEAYSLHYSQLHRVYYRIGQDRCPALWPSL